MRKLPEPMEVEDRGWDTTYPVSTYYKRDIKWLLPGYIPRAKMSLLIGEAGLGKSQFAIDLAARITTGRQMPFCSQSAEPASVLLLTAEDDIMDTVRPRLEAAGADCNLVRVFDDNSNATLADASRLVTLADTHKAALIVVDPLAEFVEEFDVRNEQNMRTLLTPLARIGTMSGAAILLIHHLNKNARGSALARSGGSHAITAVARSVITIVRDPDNTNARMLAQVKSNLCSAAHPIRFHFEQDPDTHISRIKWDSVAINVDASTLLNRAATGYDRQSAYAQAEDFLHTTLATGPMKSKELMELAMERGVSIPAVRRAKLAMTKSTRMGGLSSDGYWQTELT